jgi:hypothetical protein
MIDSQQRVSVCFCLFVVICCSAVAALAVSIDKQPVSSSQSAPAAAAVAPAGLIEEEPTVWLKRRYWGDEMSSCIEIYCLRYLGTANYLACLQTYCPDAVVAVLQRRQLTDDSVAPLLTSSMLTSSQTSGQETNTEQQQQQQQPIVVCPQQLGANNEVTQKYCIGFVCRNSLVSGSTHKLPPLDAATSRCALLQCGGLTPEEFRQCTLITCC